MTQDRELAGGSSYNRLSSRFSEASRRLRSRGYTRQVNFLLFLSFLFSFSRNIAFPYLFMYITGFPIDASLIGIMMLTAGLVYTFALLFTGSLCDRFGRRKMLLAFMTPQVLITALYSVANTFEQFFVIYLTSSMLGAFYDPAFSAMIADLVEPSKREEVYGLSYMIANVSTVVAPLLGGAIAVLSGYPVLFLISAGLVSLCTVVVWVFIKESYSSCERGDTGLRQLAGIFKHRIFVFFCLLGALTNVVYSQFYGLLSVYIDKYVGLKPYLFGVLFSINGIMVVILQIPIRIGAVKLGSTRAFTIAQAFYAVGFASFMWARDFFQFLVGVALLTIGEIIFAPATSAFVANLAPADKRGRYMALLGLFYGIGASVGSLMGFSLFDVFTDKSLVWGVLGIIGVVALPGYVYLMQRTGKSSSALSSD